MSLKSLPLALAAGLALSLCVPVPLRAQTPATNAPDVLAPASAVEYSPAAPTVLLPLSVPDPLEPLNRAVWSFNQGLLRGVIKPSSKVYRFIVVQPVRTGISNFGHNLKYPGRLINNMLQGKWTGARDETYRFLCNTTIGVAGFFDVADKWKIPRSDADFGQTFGQWGWQPKVYLMLPLLGPSNDRDAVGFAADTASNPLIYISPYDFEAKNPLTYLGPYTYFTYGVMYNNLTETVRETVRFNQAEADSYSEIQYAWTFVRANRVANFEVKGDRDDAALETLESVFFSYKSPGFPDQGKTRSVKIPATGRNLKFTFWLQPKPAPVVYIVPGLGSHRLAETSVALAELAFTHGFSAVCVSSPFHPEFMEQASTATMPAYLPVDGHDLHVALTEIDRQLRKGNPGRLGPSALLGYSMGALESLYIAATGPTNQEPLMKFDRYVALNTPVRLAEGVVKLDEFYRAPLEWPVAEQTENIQNTFLKVAALSQSSVAPRTTLPFSAIESRFLIGLAFRLKLRDIIFSSQRRYDQGVLKNPLSKWRRDPVYQEILRYGYADYFKTFVVPSCQPPGQPALTPEAVETDGDLRTYAASLRANAAIRIINNQNDFLLTEADHAWLSATFDADRSKVFPTGGHLGNLANPEVQQSILDALAGLKP